MNLNEVPVILSIDPEFSEWIPPLTDEEYKALELSIIEEGCRDAIIVWNGVIIDGHNRYDICRKAGIPFQTKEITFESREEAQNWIDKNQLARRNLTPDQMSVLRGRWYNREDRRQGERTDLTSGQFDPKSDHPTAEKIAQACGVSERTVRRDAAFVKDLEAFAKDHPEEAKVIFTGKGKSRGEYKDSKKLLNKWKQEKAEQEKPPQPPVPQVTGKYQCIVIDPPWEVKKILRDNRPNQNVFPYPVLSDEEIQEIPIPDIADEGCHLYLWTTHKKLPSALKLAESWGFNYQCLMTWVKNVGFTPFSWMYSTEHVLFCKKGSLDLLQKGRRLDFSAKVREHSRKPDEFYDLVREVSPGPRLDMFSREKRDGFEQWGSETSKFGGQ